MSKEDIKLGLDKYSVAILLLDNRNYRLEPEAIAYNQKELCEKLEDYDLFPIAESMADNGYFEEEPMIGIPSEDKHHIIIIEGNRRLTTIKFLTDPTVRALSKSYNKEWEKLSERVKGNNKDLSKIPVVVHATREELDAVVGFRHITSTLKWEPLSKARFTYDLVERNQPKNLYEIGKQVGARQDTIRNNYVAYNLYRQAKSFGIDVSQVEEKFGVFYTALSNSDISTYIGLDADKPIEELKVPISNAKKEELQNLIELLHGTAKITPVITDSRRIADLGEVLANAEARKVLVATRDMTLALKSTQTEEKSLIEYLENARINLKEAYKSIFEYSPNPKVQTLVESIKGQWERILEDYEKGKNAATVKK